MSTVVVHVGGIGDLLLAAPALARLAEDGPLDLVGRPERVALLVHAGIARAGYSLDGVDLASAFCTPSDNLRQYLRSYDRAVVWMRDAEAVCKAMRSAGIADVRAFPGVPPAGWREHASQYFLELLGLDDAPSVRLTFSEGTPQHDVVVHPGSGGRMKVWPIARYLAVVEALRSLGRTVTWCAGPAEEGLGIPSSDDVLRCERLVDLARHLAGCRAYLGNDSGVSHLAAACGARCTVIFGPTNERVWAPRGDCVRVLRGEPWPSVDDVVAAVDGNW